MTITRRTLLRKLSLGAGCVILPPFLQRLRAAERGDAPPKRVVFVLQSNGFHPWAAQPQNLKRTENGPGEVVDLPLEDYDLSEDMKPLQEHRWRTTIIQRLHGEHCRPYHSARFGALAGKRAHEVGRVASAETIDARLARIHPATFPLVNLAVKNDDNDSTDRSVGLYACSSAWGPQKPIGAQLDPNLAYQALFGPAAAKIDQGGKLLDEVRGDVKRIESELTPAEREKFAEHLDAFETLDQRKALFQKNGRIPADAKPTHGERFSSTLESKRLEAQFELAAAALTSGLTNTVTIASGACDTNGSFQGLGFDKAHQHKVGHFKDFDSKFTWKAVYTKLRQFHFQQIANLIEKLTQASDHDGSSVMENTLIVYTSDGAHTHHSNGKEWPFVVIGNWGGKLRTGRFLEYPKARSEGSRVINRLYCSLLRAAGVDAESFNLSQEDFPNQMGPLAEILA